MIPWLFTTVWGLLYLAVLVLLMGPALLRAERRWLAAAMFLLFVLDRLAVNALPQELALFFLAFAYTLVAFAVTITHRGRAAKLVGAALLATSIALIAGGFALIDWDIAGTIQELCGLIAMVSIIWGNRHGPGVIQSLDGRAAGPRSDLAGSAVSRREARK